MSFPAYEFYEDSGNEWLGELPSGWIPKRLKYVSSFITVGIVVNPSSYVSDEGLPFIYRGDIREGIIDYENSRCISAESSEANAKTQLATADFLVVYHGENSAGIKMRVLDLNSYLQFNDEMGYFGK